MTRHEVTQLGMTVQFNNYQAEITKNPTNNPRALLGYEIHYREIDEATFKAENLTKYGGRDACGDDEWQIIDHPPSDQEMVSESPKSLQSTMCAVRFITGSIH